MPVISSSESISVALIVAVTTPVVRALTAFASATVTEPVIVIASSPNPLNPAAA